MVYGPCYYGLNVMLQTAYFLALQTVFVCTDISLCGEVYSEIPFTFQIKFAGMHSMKAQPRTDVWLQSFLVLALD